MSASPAFYLPPSSRNRTPQMRRSQLQNFVQHDLNLRSYDGLTRHPEQLVEERQEINQTNVGEWQERFLFWACVWVDEPTNPAAFLPRLITHQAGSVWVGVIRQKAIVFIRFYCSCLFRLV